jgi:hypothetical protein
VDGSGTWTGPDGLTKTWTVNNAYPSFVGNTNEVTQIEINDGIIYDTIMRVDPATGEATLQSEDSAGQLIIQKASGMENGAYRRPAGIYRGDDVTGALDAINAGASLVSYAEQEATRRSAEQEATRRSAEQEATRRSAEQEAARRIEDRANAYMTDINPFIRRDGGNESPNRPEYANVNLEQGSVQIIAQTDSFETLGDRSAAYFADRASDGKLTETFMQYSGVTGTLSTRNFYQLVTESNGTQTATLHIFNPATGEYTASPARMEDALASREDNLGAIRLDRSIRYAYPQGSDVLRNEIQRELAGTEVTLNQVVFGSGEPVSPGHGFSNNALFAIDRSVIR